MGELSAVEICAGAGGQALGLEQAGFSHEAAAEIDVDACETLRRNRGAAWKIIEGDVELLEPCWIVSEFRSRCAREHALAQAGQFRQCR